MNAKIIVNDEAVPISWENEIGIDAILYVCAPSFIYATAAVQFLLRQLGYHHLWYANEVTFKAGVFRFKIVEVEEADRYNSN